MNCLPLPPSLSHRAISEAVKLCQPRVPPADIYQDYLLLSGTKTYGDNSVCEFSLRFHDMSHKILIVY